MPDLTDFYLNSNSDVVQFETIEISHPNFTRSYFFVRNNTAGLTATLETAASQVFEYYPMSITENGSSNDLDYSLNVELGDLGEVLPLEINAIAVANGLFVEPIVVYRTFRSDDLSSPMIGPINLKLKSFASNKVGSVFEAKADNANSQRTGELYTASRFPMLRAFL